MERLQKVIARAGIASRRKAEQLILDGRVAVNGKVIDSLGTKVSATDRVAVDGVPLDKEKLVYYLFYKPVGVISSVKDDRGRRTVVDFFKQVPERIFPVGRLDYDTSGALLLTNDGALANRLMHPSYKFNKTYIAEVRPLPTAEQLSQLANGIHLEDGMTAKARVKLLSSNQEKRTASVQLTIHEGRNRQVRRMYSALHLHVCRLKRERYGFLDLKGLHPGEARELTAFEVKTLARETDTQK
jgi:23S rRNA pseudouridine2605 synthase